jgi:uncharacterized protein (DUF2267 family)
MDSEEFEKKVSSGAGVPRDRSRELIRAVLETLAERLTGGEAKDLAAQLPKPMKEWLTPTGEQAERFGLDEFIRRVSERTRVPPEEARRVTQAVFATLRMAVTTGEFEDVMSQLPGEFRELLAQPAARPPL